MLKVYGISWCPHCKKIVRYLVESKIDFQYFDMDGQPEDVVKKVIDVNGGHDWRVPTLEFQDQWIPGKAFSSSEVDEDLKKLSVI